MIVLKLLCFGFAVIVVVVIWGTMFGGGRDVSGGLCNGMDSCSPSGVTVFFATAAAVTVGGFSFCHGSLSGFDLSFNTGQGITTDRHHRFSKHGLHNIIGLLRRYGLLGPVWNKKLTFFSRNYLLKTTFLTRFKA